jgi:hypothetical protein
VLPQNAKWLSRHPSSCCNRTADRATSGVYRARCALGTRVFGVTAVTRRCKTLGHLDAWKIGAGPSNADYVLFIEGHGVRVGEKGVLR